LSVSKSCLGAGYTTRRCAGRRSRCAIASTEERTDRGDEEHGERRDGSLSMWLKVQGGFMFSLWLASPADGCHRRRWLGLGRRGRLAWGCFV